MKRVEVGEMMAGSSGEPKDGAKEISLEASRVVLRTLRESVTGAAAYFPRVDETLFDGHQTAREVLSHLVFWHREYVLILQVLADGCRPSLRMGTFDHLNRMAACEFKDRPMKEMAESLSALHVELEAVLGCLPDWSLDFPVKVGARRRNVAERLTAIESHFRYHVKRLKRAERLGRAWMEAYYPDAS
jgi:hypothetical protein